METVWKAWKVSRLKFVKCKRIKEKNRKTLPLVLLHCEPGPLTKRGRFQRQCPQISIPPRRFVWRPPQLYFQVPMIDPRKSPPPSDCSKPCYNTKTTSLLFKYHDYLIVSIMCSTICSNMRLHFSKLHYLPLLTMIQIQVYRFTVFPVSIKENNERCA